MSDYLEEQENEIEALKSIYPDEFKDVHDTPPTFTILVRSDETVAHYEVTLKITYTDSYPDELPEFTVIVPDDSTLSKDEKAQLKQAVQQTAEESLGMVMVFSMTSMLKDTLDDILIRKKEAEEQAIQAKRDKELEAEQAKFIGTRTSKETFMVWKQKFDAEMAEKGGQRAAVAKKNKLTGKQLFIRDKSLAKSDSSYMDADDHDIDPALLESKLTLDSPQLATS